METNEITDKSLGSKPDYKSKFNNRVLGGVILGVSGISAVIAGIITSQIAKKRSKEFLKELGKEQITPVVLENPYALGIRALAWGTVWAVGGCSLIMFGIWKWYGFKDLDDLRTKARNRIKKPNSNSEERTDFESLSEFLNYLNDMSKAETKADSTKTS